MSGIYGKPQMIGIAPLVAKDPESGDSLPIMGIYHLTPGMVVKSYSYRVGVVGAEKTVESMECDEFGVYVHFVGSGSITDGFPRNSVFAYVRG